MSASPVHVKCRTDTAVQGMILCWLCEFGACFCSCAQSGNGRHSSHQRKINQQEESCQNLTDFTPARVPSKVDIFTAYNDSLQCSHECVRAGIPVYTDEMIQHTPIYKTSYNGNRQESNINIYSVEKKTGLDVAIADQVVWTAKRLHWQPSPYILTGFGFLSRFSAVRNNVHSEKLEHWTKAEQKKHYEPMYNMLFKVHITFDPGCLPF